MIWRSSLQHHWQSRVGALNHGMKQQVATVLLLALSVESNPIHFVFWQFALFLSRHPLEAV